MRIIGNMAIDPMKVTSDCRCRCYNQKFFEAKTRYGHVSFDMAIIIQKLRIDDFPNRNRNVICRNDLQHRLGIAANQFNFAKAGHVKHPHLLPNRHMFSRAIVKPVLPTPAIFIFGFFALFLFRFRQKPIGAFPSGNLAKTRAFSIKIAMNWRPPNATRRRKLAIGEMIGIKQPKRF